MEGDNSWRARRAIAVAEVNPNRVTTAVRYGPIHLAVSVEVTRRDCGGQIVGGQRIGRSKTRQKTGSKRQSVTAGAKREAAASGAGRRCDGKGCAGRLTQETFHVIRTKPARQLPTQKPGNNTRR